MLSEGGGVAKLGSKGGQELGQGGCCMRWWRGAILPSQLSISGGFPEDPRAGLLHMLGGTAHATHGLLGSSGFLECGI